MRHLDQLDPYYGITAEEKVASVIQKSPFVANVPPQESREQGLGPTDREQESGLFPHPTPAHWRMGQSPRKEQKLHQKNFLR